MHFRGTFHQWKYKESGVKLKSMVWKEKRQKAALLWTSILVEFSKQKQKKKHDLDVALSCYCELRLKPRPLIQFYFSLFYDLFCEGWYVRLCISRMASNFFFSRCFGLDLNKICFAFAHMFACVCCVLERTRNMEPCLSRRQLSLSIQNMQSYLRERE